MDYRRLNAKTVGDAYPLPRIDDCLDSLGGASIFSTLDCNAGYWQVPVAPEDQDKTTFTSYMGTFRYVRMPFGLRNAPATFQRALDIILSRVRWQTCLIYLDDVIVFSHTVAEHLRHVDEVLTLLRAAGVTLKLSKCRFFQPKVDYLGHVITPGKLHVATANTQAFESAKFPRSLTQLRSFLGAANVYRRFVKDYAKIARPLNSMLSKDAEPDWDDPSPDQIEAFDTLKARLVAPPILGLPMKDRPFMIDTDASAYQLGATLLQQQSDERPTEWTPIGYWSKTLNTAECNYTATERECYSVVWAITSLRPYVEGLKFHVRTDHDALRWLLTLTDSSGRLLRWRLRLAEFDFTVTYRPGRVHQVPDALSRLESEFDDGQPVDDDVPTFGDHEAILVTTRRMAARAGEAPTEAPPASETADQSSGSAVPGDPPPENTGTNAETPTAVDTEVPAVENNDEALDDVLDEELDLFDVINVYQDDGTRPQVADVQLPLTRDELLDAQRHDDFCQTVLARQSPKIDSAFFEGHDGLLRRRVPNEGDAVQIVAPQTLRPRILHMLHNNVLSLSLIHI